MKWKTGRRTGWLPSATDSCRSAELVPLLPLSRNAFCLVSHSTGIWLPSATAAPDLAVHRHLDIPRMGSRMGWTRAEDYGDSNSSALHSRLTLLSDIALEGFCHLLRAVHVTTTGGRGMLTISSNALMDRSPADSAWGPFSARQPSGPFSCYPSARPVHFVIASADERWDMVVIARVCRPEA